MLEPIFQSAGISSKKRSELQHRLAENQGALQALIAWLIYGYEHRTASGAGITSPVLFAISRYADSLPGPGYITLAALPPAELHRLIRNRFAPGIRQDLKRILAALEANGFVDLLPPPVQEQATGPVPTTPAGPVQDIELVPPAEEIWEAVRREAQVPAELAPVSLWLNGHTLSLSFIHEEHVLDVAQAIEARRGELCRRLPGYALQLRTLEMRQSGSQSLPVVAIKSEQTISLK